jgi:hypothetical protein
MRVREDARDPVAQVGAAAGDDLHDEGGDRHPEDNEKSTHYLASSLSAPRSRAFRTGRMRPGSVFVGRAYSDSPCSVSSSSISLPPRLSATRRA